jgi:hypothetical protein
MTSRFGGNVQPVATHVRVISHDRDIGKTDCVQVASCLAWLPFVTRQWSTPGSQPTFTRAAPRTAVLSQGRKS